MNVRNYQKEMELVIQQHEKMKQVPSLLLHSCCAPCSSYVLEYLSQYFYITIDYYNPNIYPPEEYEARVAEQERLIVQSKAGYPISLLVGDYDPSLFYQTVRGYEDAGEGSQRCYRCYELRLEHTASLAAQQRFDYFTTTLSISPMKKVHWLNEIGERLADHYQIKYLNADFKKKDGYKRSVQLSSEYGLYRQEYCGCVFSLAERAKQQQRGD